MIRRARFVIVPLLFIATVSSVTWAQVYPARPIRLIVGLPPGGAIDIVARIIGQKVGESVKQQIVIDNRPGASGVIASQITAKAAPDGYTLFMHAITNHTISASLYKKLPYDSVKDFAAVILVASAPIVLVANPSLPANSVTELIALARARPGQINFASSGSGGTTHLAGELLKFMANINLTHVPYKGGGAATTTALLAGEISVTFGGSAVDAQVQSGKLRALATTGPARSARYPDLPTIGETVPGFEMVTWYGLFAPAGTPAEAMARLRTEVARFLALADTREKISRRGPEPWVTTPEQFAGLIRAGYEKHGKLVRALGVKAD